MLLAVSLAFSMTGGFAFASDEGADGAGSAIGTSSVEGETGKPETPALPDKIECTCPPVDSGEVVHSKDCPLYEVPEAPTASDAVKAVDAQIKALAAAADAGEAPDANAVKAARRLRRADRREKGGI